MSMLNLSCFVSSGRQLVFGSLTNGYVVWTVIGSELSDGLWCFRVNYPLSKARVSMRVTYADRIFNCTHFEHSYCNQAEASNVTKHVFTHLSNQLEGIRF